jgi:hypothetical protein
MVEMIMRPTLPDLDLRGQRVIPASVWDRGDLLRLELRAFPDAVRALRRLRYLSIDGNALTRVPDWIGEVASLVELRVRGNAITELPEAIGGLARCGSCTRAGTGSGRCPPRSARCPSCASSTCATTP